MIVSQPFADLRREPVSLNLAASRDLLQETQLLYGEKVHVLEQRGSWARVEAIEQHNYPGWVSRDALSELKHDTPQNLVITAFWTEVGGFGTRLAGVDYSDDRWQVHLPTGGKAWLSAMNVQPLALSMTWREDLIAHGKRFINSCYFWGGRTAPNGNLNTGVDCSGLVNLLYRIYGIDLPRNAFDQLHATTPISPHELQVADLVFMTSTPTSKRVDHVLLYAGGELLLEATMVVGKVRLVTFSERFGYTLSDLKKGKRPLSMQVAFGACFPKSVI